MGPFSSMLLEEVLFGRTRVNHVQAERDALQVVTFARATSVLALLLGHLENHVPRYRTSLHGCRGQWCQDRDGGGECSLDQLTLTRDLDAISRLVAHLGATGC
jgi:hypothetical protein